MPPDDRVRLEHMVEAAENALRYAAGHDRGELDGDSPLQYALLHAVQIVLEASWKLSAAPEVDWAAMAGMRHRLVHDYFDIDNDVLWRSVQEDLPALLSTLHSMLEA
jgi:uncharacterized protein with HEPN domain